MHRNVTFRLIPSTRNRARRLASLAGACSYLLKVEGTAMNRLANHTDLVAVRAGADDCEGKVAAPRLDNEVTLERLHRLEARTVELRPESTEPEHQPRRVDLEREELQIDGIMADAIIDTFSPNPA